MTQHKINTRKVELHGREFKLYDITFYVGTEHERTVTAAESALEVFICDRIRRNRYTEEILRVDKQFDYYVSAMADGNDEKAIIESILYEAYWDEDDSEWSDSEFEIVH